MNRDQSVGTNSTYTLNDDDEFRLTKTTTTTTCHMCEHNKNVTKTKHDGSMCEDANTI